MNIKDLKVGDELECVDRDSFTRERISTKDAIDFVLTVDAIDHNSVYVRSQLNANHVAHFHIYLDELRFFKKKEQSQYTFNDLVDVAAQAYKDGVLSGLSLDNVGARKVSCWSEGFSDHAFDQLNDYKRIIDSIKSLYKETFVIECLKDIEKIKVGAEIRLLNENTINVLSNNGAKVQSSYTADALSLVSLQGATVEQSK